MIERDMITNLIVIYFHPNRERATRQQVLQIILDLVKISLTAEKKCCFKKIVKIFDLDLFYVLYHFIIFSL